MYLRFCLAALIVLITAAAPTRSDAQGLALVRDTEIEADIRIMATPLFEAAGLEPKAVNIILVNDRSLNAFVAAGQNLFINTGLIIRTEDAGQLIGVIAHETGHIAGGHLARQPDALENALVTSLLSMVVGAAAAVAAQNSSGVMAGMMAGESMAMRNYFSFTRGIEASADQAGVNFLDRTQQSSRGFLSFMQLLQGQEFLSTNRQDPYLRTHPLSSSRVDFLRGHVATSPWSDVPLPPAFVLAHQRMRGKLVGFLDVPTTTLARFPATDTRLEARYARAVAYYRIPDVASAVKEIDALIKDYPNDPYFYELKGQVLFENGKVTDALPSYQKAAQLLPTAPLIRIDLAQVMLETNDPQYLAPALSQLLDASTREADMPKLWRLMAVAYGRKGDLGNAASALAQQALLEGRRDDARDQARRAMRLLPSGTPGWLRAQDIETTALRRTRRQQEDN